MTRRSARRELPTVLLRGLAVVLLTALATGARGDRKETYTVLGYEAGAKRYSVPASGSGSVTSYAGAFSLSAYYGLSHSLHVGGRVRVTSSSDVHFSNVTLRTPDGSQSTGDVYNDHLGIGAGALILYRVDTGLALAPVFELEGGFTVHRYHNAIHVPSGVTYSVSLPDVSETVLHGSGALLVEYRFRNRWILATGVGVQFEPAGLAPWSAVVPFRVGRIW